MVDNIAAGADVNQRIGRRIRIRRIGFQGTLLGGQTNSAADDAFNSFRVIVYVCTPGLTLSGLNPHQYLDPRYQSGLFQVLYDRTVVLRVNAKDSVGYIPAAKLWSFSLPVNIPVEYASTAVSAPVGRDIRMYAVSDSVAVVHPGFSAESTLLLEFDDDK